MTTNKQTGYDAEDRAAEYLTSEGFEILDHNWHNRWCEIDIVARRGNRVYFVKVKYRKNSSQSTGLDYITPKKLKQMSFAAEMWVSDHNWVNEYQLSAVSITDSDMQFIENVD